MNPAISHCNSNGPRISVVVISFNMDRELPRVLYSLAPPYQQGLEPGDVEIIVVDNGSRTLPGIEGLPFGTHLISVDGPTPSPAHAVNIGLKEATSDLVGVFIDGARLASPGLCHAALLASRLRERVVVATLGFHLGHELQMESVRKGYCQEVEDRLLSSVDWRRDGYRLFDISVFAGSCINGWFRPIAESNALFMPRALWNQLGGYEEAFTSPGGGLVNLDAYIRACELPDTELVTLLGEGTFHQVHGGVATNRNDPAFTWDVFHQEYQRIRNREFRMPEKKTLYLGTIPPQMSRFIKESAALL